MKKLLIAIAAIMLMASCQNFVTRNFGGHQVIELKKGQRLVEITFKESELWILTEPMDSDYIPKSKTFYEKSNFEMMEGEIIIIESK